MLLASDVSADQLRSLELVAVGGGALSPADHAAFEERFGVPILTAYGATEFGGVVAGWTLDAYRQWGASKRGSAGRALGAARLRIVDETSGDCLANGQVGLLEVVSPRIGEQWVEYHIIHLARIDEDGFLFLTGRADGAIDRGGFKVVPEMVADALRAFPRVADAAVAGLPDARLGAVPVAAVEPRPGSSVAEDELLAFLRERLPAYQLPCAIRIVDALPRNASLKVSLADVRTMFE
ncbi:class I adenylate-forming enzyme family protein [Sphingomonas sp. MMS24-JH45]